MRARLVAALLAVVALVSFGSNPAEAGTTCSIVGFCGTIKVMGGSSVGIVHNWVAPIHYDRVLAIGHWSYEYYADTDGYYIGAGWCTSIYKFDSHNRAFFVKNDTAGYRKITDLDRIGLWPWRC